MSKIHGFNNMIKVVFLLMQQQMFHRLGATVRFAEILALNCRSMQCWNFCTVFLFSKTQWNTDLNIYENCFTEGYLFCWYSLSTSCCQLHNEDLAWDIGWCKHETHCQIDSKRKNLRERLYNKVFLVSYEGNYKRDLKWNKNK